MNRRYEELLEESWQKMRASCTCLFSLCIMGWICYTLITLEENVDHYGYQMFFPGAGLICLYGFASHQLKPLAIGFLNFVLAFVIEYHISETQETKLDMPFNPMLLHEKLENCSKTLFNHNKLFVILLIIRPILYFYIFWFMTEVRGLEDSPNRNSADNENTIMGYLREHHPNIHIFFRAIFPGHPIIHSNRYYYVIFGIVSVMLMWPSAYLNFSY